MTATIVRESPSRLMEYAQVSIAFVVTEVFGAAAVRALLRGETPLASPVRPPYWKDYDASVGNRPTDWQHRFDISRWTIHVASVEDRRVGGAVVIGNDQGIDLLRNCPDCALVWDVRVAPDVRGQGIGSALLRSVEDVARRDGARALRVETQQNNVPACRFYLRNGFQLEPAMAGAYPDLPDELQLLWRKPL